MLTGVFATLKLASRKVKHGKCRQQAAKTILPPRAFGLAQRSRYWTG